MHKTKRTLSILFVVLFLSDNLRNNKLQGFAYELAGNSLQFILTVIPQTIMAFKISMDLKKNQSIAQQSPVNQKIIKTHEDYSISSVEVANSKVFKKPNIDGSILQPTYDRSIKLVTASTENSSSVTTSINKYGMPAIKVEHGNAYMNIELRPYENPRESIGYSQLMEIITKPEVRMRYLNILATFQECSELLAINTLEAKRKATKRLLELDLKKMYMQTRLEEVRDSYIAICTKVVSDRVHIDHRHENDRDFFGKLIYCANKHAELNKTLNERGFKYPETAQEILNRSGVKINVSRYYVPDRIIFQEYDWWDYVKSMYTGKPIRVSLTSGYLHTVGSAFRPSSDKISSLYTLSGPVADWLKSYNIDEICKQVGLIQDTEAWRCLTDREKQMILVDEDKIQYMAIKTQLEAMSTKAYVDAFKLDISNSGVKIALNELVGLSLNSKTFAQKDQLLLDIALGKKYANVREHFVNPNGILKCYANCGNVVFANQFVLNTKLSKNIQEQVIIAVNKLCGSLLNENNKACSDSIHAGLYALKFSSAVEDSMATSLLTISNGVVRALEGEEYYQPILSEKEFWPFVFRHGGPNKQDLSAIMEHASLFSDYEETRFFSLLSDSHGVNYKETLLKKEKETLKKKAAKKAEEAAALVGLGGGAPDPDDKDPDDKDKERYARQDAKNITNKEIRQIAKKLGYTETKDYKFNSHGELVFRKGNRFITRDATGHKGGFWKMFRNGVDRIGTFDINLNKIGS